MPQNLRSVALVVVALLVMGVPLLWSGSQQPDAPAVAAPDTTAPSTPTTTTPELDPIVASHAVHLAAEMELLDEVQSAAITTTTIAPETSTTEDQATEDTAATTTTTAPQTTSTSSAAPPTTNPPASTTTSTSTTTTTTAPAGGYSSSAEGDFASSINSYRSSNGHSSLSRDGSLDSYARSWAKRMADDGGIGHSNVGSLIPPWSSVGENVGTGSSVSAVFNALKASSGHSANMLGDFTHMGIGVYRDGSGQLWTAHVFAR